MSPADRAAAPAPALDEVMMAMDVVDTLRHNENVAVQEMGQDGRDGALKDKLRRIYEGQGLAVSDAILEEGIKALKESRFVYTPSGSAGARRLADWWVRRATLGKWAAVVVIALGAWAGWTVFDKVQTARVAQATRIELSDTLPRQLQEAVDAAQREATSDAAKEYISQLETDTSNAIARSDIAAARADIAKLQQARQQIAQTYVLRIVSKAGERSAVYRIPDSNRAARNYYLIVEAVTPDGSALSMPITNEENNQTETVAKWGIRVPQATYETVGRDKADDGIIQNNIVGRKVRGTLKPTYDMPVMNGAITRW